MGKDKPLGGKAAAAKEAKDKAAVAAAKEKGVEMCVTPTCSRFLLCHKNVARTKHVQCSSVQCSSASHVYKSNKSQNKNILFKLGKNHVLISLSEVTCG